MAPLEANAPGIPQLDGTVEETASGLCYIDEEIGDGDTPTAGQTVVVHYTGWLTDGQQFDSSIGGGPIGFAIGVGQVIKGWDEGLLSMRVNGKRRLIIPSALGYGDRGAGAAIPGGATLIFDVELLGLQ